MIWMSLFTTENTIDWAFGERLIRVLFDASELLVPEVGVIGAPTDWTKRGYKIEKPANFSKFWGAMAHYKTTARRPGFSVPAGVFWRRAARVKYEGGIDHTRFDEEGYLKQGWIRLYSSWSDKVDWLSLFRRWSELLKPTQAALDFEQRGRVYIPGSFHPELKHFPWASVMGHERARFVDAAKLRAEGFFVEEMETGFLIRLTEKFSDLKKKRDHVEAQRARLKTLFPPEALRSETACPELLSRLKPAPRVHGDY